ncbi:PAS domain S-box protein [Chamaesiphon sp.]|uniref:PAS domain S-box protein n=1 Tax=Chamaesiphon sp. TaxID=2814140 RepID=UPI0035947A54
MHIPTFTLLIVEDFAIQRELCRQTLSIDSCCVYHLLEAESVAAGLALCRSSIIDAILLDYALPDGDGLAFLAALETQSNGSSPPVVMLTGMGDERIAVRAMKLGAEDYLVKCDLTPQLLQSTIRSAIENTRLRLQLQQSQERLQAKNQQITTIWESMTDAYITLDREWRIVYTNPTATELVRQLVGLAPEEFLGKTHWEAFPWSVGNIVEQEYRRAVTDRVTVHFEVLYEPTSTWFEIHAYPSEIGLGIYFRDINERKRNEAERIQAERERDRFFDLSLNLLVIANFDGYFVRLNPAWEQTLGFTAAELMAQPYLDFVHPDDLESTLAAATGLNTGEMVISFENRYRCKDGSYRWLLWSAMPDVEHNLSYANGRDITNRKRQEAALLQSGRKFSAIFNQTFQLMGLVSVDGVLLEVNQAALDSIAATESEIVGKSFWDAPWWHTEQLQQQLRDAIATAASGEFVRYEVEFPNPSGGVTITDFSLKPMFDEVGQVESIVAEAHDITDRKQAQADLEQRNQELDSFVYVVSHDLKAPLRGIANLSKWIEEDLEGSLSVANQQQMALLRSRVYKMQATIDGLLDYARLGIADAGVVESVSIATLLAEVIDSIAPPPTFTISLPPELPTLSTRRLPLFQVFANLIGNGIKHHDRVDGSIQISIAKRATKAVEDRGDCYEFAVSDDGPGIAPEHHDRMFKIFQAVNPQNRSDSTGIGLAIVKKIVEAEGGTIWLESELGKGTTFYFTWLQR